MTKTEKLLDRRVQKILPSKTGLEALLSKRKIRLYQGFDPTGKLHIGHGIGLRLLMKFARAGHEVIFLFGTGTVLVGDPSQRESGRAEITQAEIDGYIKGWKQQAASIVDFDKIQVKQNGDWLTKLTLEDLIGVASKISATQLFKRESFQNRIKRGDTVWYHETMYPLLQGYDSVVLDVDLEIGGTDQEFNMLMGRELLKKIKNKEKYVLMIPLILGIDGKKMSASQGNCVWIDDPSEQMYGKLMSIADSQVPSYLELCTDLSDTEVETATRQLKIKPRNIKALMAKEIVKIYHSEKAAEDAAKAFNSQFKDRQLPADIPIVKLDKFEWELADLLTVIDLASSKTAARRIIEQGGVKINSKPVSKDGTWKLKAGDVVQVGKRHFAKIA